MESDPIFLIYSLALVSMMRMRSWQHRNQVRCRLVDRQEVEGMRDLVDDYDDDESEIDSAFSPSCDDLIFGVEVNNEIVGVDIVRVDQGIGHVEGVKVAKAFYGKGLEAQLRKYSLQYLRHHFPVVHILRQLVFEWNWKAKQVAVVSGMQLLLEFEYAVLEDLGDSNASNLPMLTTATTIAQVEIALLRHSEKNVLLQYWDIYDLTYKTLRWLCSSFTSDADDFDDSTESSEICNFSYKRSCIVKLGHCSCSMGEMIDRGDTLGKLCTFTVYCNVTHYKAQPDECENDCLAHINHWYQLAKRSKCQSIIAFVPKCLGNILPNKKSSSISLYEIKI